MPSKVPSAKPPAAGVSLLQAQPQQPIDPLQRPFVGNETIDDNLRESVKVAVWTVMGDRERGLEIAVVGGVATLSGPVADRMEAALALKAVLSITGITEVVDRLVPVGSSTRLGKTSDSTQCLSHAAMDTSIVSLTRFCGLDDASTGAAIRQAVGRLDHFFGERKLSAPDTLIILYRNLIPGAITLDLGFPVPANGNPRIEGEFTITHLPPLDDQVAITVPGLLPIITTLRDLMRAGHPSAWQVLHEDEFRPWRGHPALPLNVARGM